MKLKKLLSKKLVCIFAAGLLISNGGFYNRCAEADTNKEDLYSLTIMHTNDIHGNVDNLPKYSTIINKVRSSAKNCLVLDSGDLFMRGEFEDEQGIPEVEMLNAMKYDAWVPGNNDFKIPFKGSAKDGNKQLKKLTDKADFKAVCANVTMKSDKSYIKDMAPYTIKNINGAKIAIIGVTSLKPQLRNLPEVSDKFFEEGDIAVEKTIKELKGKSDINIVISHTGLSTDLKIADIDGVDAVLGADDHYFISQPIYKTNGKGGKGTPITQDGGEENHYLGRLDLAFEKNNDKYELVDFNGYLYENLNLIKDDEKIVKIINKHRENKGGKKAA